MVKKLLLIVAPIILFGATYKLVEPDILSEVESRKDRVVSEVSKQSKREMEEFKKLKGETLTKATKTYAYYVDPTYTLAQDIPRVDRDGHTIGVLYPKGYTFNPLNYIQISPPPIVVFNACDKKEVSLVKQLTANRPDAMYASSGCEIEDFPKDIGHQMYLVTKEMKEKFNLKSTVSVITVDLQAKRIKVEVYKASR
ncbi:MAG: hypothetical protein WCW84_11315 [Sulfurimonas sp.]|jgi:conjugal transfer pilus assembly protein TraW